MPKKLDVPLTSISEVKRSPMDIFFKASKEGSGVYVFNREKIAGVMLTQKQYESLLDEIEELADQLTKLKAEERLLNGAVSTFPDSAVRGSIATALPSIDKEDGWE